MVPVYPVDEPPNLLSCLLLNLTIQKHLKKSVIMIKKKHLSGILELHSDASKTLWSGYCALNSIVTKYNHFYVIKIISSKAQDLKILQSNMWHVLYIPPTKFNCIFATSVRTYFDHFWKETLILTCFMDNFNCCIQFLFNMLAKLTSISEFKYDYCITLFKTMITVLDDLKN